MAAVPPPPPNFEDNEAHLAKLLQPNGQRQPNPHGLPLHRWYFDLLEWPELEYPKIHFFLTSRPSEYAEELKEGYRGYKNLKAYQLGPLVSKVAISFEKNYCFLGADVKTDKDHEVMDTSQGGEEGERNEEKRPAKHTAWMCLQNDTADIHAAHCMCMESGGPICNHATALLFKIELMVRLGYTKTERERCQTHPWDDMSDNAPLEPLAFYCRPITQILADRKGKKRKRKGKRRWKMPPFTEEDQLNMIRALKGVY